MQLARFGIKDVIEHAPGTGFSKSKRFVGCTSFFIEKPDWMPEYRGQLEGKLNCPKCGGRFGSWSWAGAQCSCGRWNTPSFQALKSRIDLKHPVTIAVAKSPGSV